MADRPHFRVPLEFSTGPSPALVVVEQDTEQEIEQCVEAVTRYERGSRLTLMQFGIADPTFSQVTTTGLDASDIVAAILEWEPRAEDVLIEQSSASIVGAIMGVALRLRMTEGSDGG